MEHAGTRRHPLAAHDGDATHGRLLQTAEVMDGAVGTASDRTLCTGVDLGTACTVVVATDGHGTPLAGAYEWTRVVRDGVVVDFHGAIAVLRRLTAEVEQRLGRALVQAASGHPPGVGRAEVRAVGHVLEGAGLRCVALLDEPTAANAVLGIREGAVVDVGGGTTGTAVFAGGRLVASVDEPTGGVHASLVIAGAHGIPFAEAELLKRDSRAAADLAPLLRPVWEKIGAIVRDAISPYAVTDVHLVGGTCRFPTAASVIAETVGVPCTTPVDPMFVTALGLAASGGPYAER